MVKTIKCKSGMIGWRAKLRNIYSDLNNLIVHDEMYGILAKLGYVTAKAAWEENPTIEGSINPSDFSKSKKQWK
jgi:hypothetical protein